MTLPERMPNERADSGVPVAPPDDDELAAACRKGAPAAGARGRRSRVALAWVTTAEGLQHVSTWAHLPRKQRPRNTKDAPRAVTCPVCRRPVVIRIPRWRAHHAAHAPGDRCPVTRPETALHFNLKCLIAKELEAGIGTGRPFRVVETCFVGHWEPGRGFRSSAPPPEGVHRSEWQESTPCGSSRERVWLETWDRVELEERVGDARAARVPDVVLYRGGKEVGAVEVFHSHGVDDAKARVLADLGVPWIEVKASEALIEEAEAWALGRPLPVHREGPARRWRCAAHEEALRCALEEDRRQREAQQRRLEAARRREAAAREAAREAARHTRRVLAVKLVDLLYPTGKQWRNVYRVVELSTDGTPHTLQLERGADTLLDLALASAPKRILVAQIEAKVAADLRAVESRRGATTDCAMRWAKGPLAERIVGMVEDGAWQRVPLEHTHPVRYRFNPQTGEWFMPADLRDVTWDRPDSDPLTEAHPAWARRSGHSREEVTGPRNPMPLAAGSSGVPLPSPAPSTLRVPAASRKRSLPPGPGPGVDLGPTVVDVVSNAAATVYRLRPTAGRPECAVVVVERQIAPENARRIDEALKTAGVERLWLSRSEHWTRVLSDLPWLPLSPGPHNGFVVPIPGGGFISAADAAAAFTNGRSEFAEAEVVERRYAGHLPS